MRTNAAAVLLALVAISGAHATPSTTYWTPCTIDIQPAGVTHLGVDDYFSVGSSELGSTTSSPRTSVSWSGRCGSTTVQSTAQ